MTVPGVPDLSADAATVQEARRWIPSGHRDENGVWHEGPHRVEFDAALARIVAQAERAETAIDKWVETGQRLDERIFDLEREAERLQQERDAALDRESGTSDAYQDVSASASGYRVDRDRWRELAESAERQAATLREALETASDVTVVAAGDPWPESVRGFASRLTSERPYFTTITREFSDPIYVDCFWDIFATLAQTRLAALVGETRT